MGRGFDHPPQGRSVLRYMGAERQPAGTVDMHAGDQVLDGVDQLDLRVHLTRWREIS